MISVLVMVAITPLVGVYIFSVEFINRGIDNWLNVDVEKGLADALELGQTVLGDPDARPARRGADGSRGSSPTSMALSSRGS